MKFEHAPDFPFARVVMALAVAVFLAAAGSIFLTRDHTEIAAVWAPNAIVLALILQQARPRWPLLLTAAYVANAAANLFMGNGWIIAIFCSLANIVEIVVCAFVLTNANTPQFDRVRAADFVRLVLGAAAGALCSSLIATLAISFRNDVAAAEVFSAWFVSDSLGLVIFTPSFAILLSGTGVQAAAGSRRSWLIWLMFVSGALLVFGQSTINLLPAAPLLFIPIALGLDAAGVGLAIALLSFIALISTAYGFGPLAADYPETTARLRYLQAFLALIALLCTPAAMALAQRRELLKTLDRRDQEWRALANSMRDVIVRYTPDTTITYLSPSCEAVLGYEPEELVGRRIQDLIHPEDAARGARDLALVAGAGRDGPMVNMRLRARHKDGRWLWFEGRPRALFDRWSGKPTVFYDVMRDVTRQVEDQAALEAARAQAESASQAKSEFVANMSHELRTPLNSVIGYSRLLAKSEALNDRDHRYAQLVEGSADATLSIINDILDGAALERGALTLRREALSIREVLNTSAALVAPMADQKGIALTVRVDDRVNEELSGDVDRLRQIMLNLSSNAVKFTDAGAVELIAELTGETHDLQHVRLLVRDTGIGIAPEYQRAIFERFTQVAGGHNAGGSGLGLSIVKQLVDLMGGTISLESESGRGSTFCVEITLFKQAAVMADVKSQVALPPLRILVADDVDLNRELAATILEQYGHLVEMASGGVEAVARCRNERFDAILMDVRMPDMSGIDATRAIRAGGASEHAVIIALTAGMRREKYAQCIAAGMDGYLAKPLQERELLEALALAAPGAVPPPAADPAVAELRARFRERLASDREALSEKNRDAAFEELVHRMAGSAGSFGFDEIGAKAAALDDILSEGGVGAEEALAALLRAIDNELGARAA